MVDYKWEFGENALECQLDFEDGEGEEKECGVVIIPAVPPSMSLISAKIAGIEIIELLCKDIILAIELSALADYMN